jgi:hypothetical protein
MSNGTQEVPAARWWESLGFVQIFRSFGLALDWLKMGLALIGIILTFGLGRALDWVWRSSDKGVPANAVWTDLHTSASAGTGQHGIFEVWRSFEGACLDGVLTSARHGVIIGSLEASTAGRSAGMPEELASALALGPQVGVLPNIIEMGRGVGWLVRHHIFYALLFFALSLLIWSFVGGAICRVAAVQFARNEKLTSAQALSFAFNKWFNGFLLAPVLPLGGIALIAVFMWLGGVFLSIHYLGDLIGGLLFVLAIIGGFLIALGLIGLVAGGSLFWPTIAAEGSDSFDAASRSYSYVYSRPVRLLFYGLVAIIFGAFVFLFIRFVAWLALVATHTVVGAGMWRTKLDTLWSLGSMSQLYAGSGPNLSGPDRISWFFIGIWVLLVAALVWSYLVSYYFSASTIVYFLLRREVDATDLDDVYIDKYEEEPATAPPPTTPAAPSGSGTPLPVIGEAPVSAASGAAEPTAPSPAEPSASTDQAGLH